MFPPPFDAAARIDPRTIADVSHVSMRSGNIQRSDRWRRPGCPVGRMPAARMPSDPCDSIRRCAAPPISRRVIVVVTAVAVGGLAVAVAVAAGGTGPADPTAPRFIEEAAVAGIDHRYDGDFEFFVGGGVAAFDCDDDGLPDLYFAGGSQSAALYRNDSRPGGTLHFTRESSAATDLAAVTGAYPLDVDGDGHTDLAVLRRGEDVILRRPSATASSSGPTSCSGSTAALRGPWHSTRCGRDRTSCRRWRSATTWNRIGNRALTADCSDPQRTTAMRRRSR